MSIELLIFHRLFSVDTLIIVYWKQVCCSLVCPFIMQCINEIRIATFFNQVFFYQHIVHLHKSGIVSLVNCSPMGLPMFVTQYPALIHFIACSLSIFFLSPNNINLIFPIRFKCDVCGLRITAYKTVQCVQITALSEMGKTW